MFKPQRMHPLCKTLLPLRCLKLHFNVRPRFLRRKGPGKVVHSSKRVNNARMRALIA